MLLPSPAELEAMLGPQRGAEAAAVTRYRTSRDKGHLSSVNLTHLELLHLPATDAHLGHQGTEGEAPAMATDPLPSAPHSDGISGWNELRRCWASHPSQNHPSQGHPCPHLPWHTECQACSLPASGLATPHGHMAQTPFFFLLLEEVEMGHGAPGCSQRGLEILVLPKATSYSWVAINPHQLQTCIVCPSQQLWHV